MHPHHFEFVLLPIFKIGQDLALIPKGGIKGAIRQEPHDGGIFVAAIVAETCQHDLAIGLQRNAIGNVFAPQLDVECRQTSNSKRAVAAAIFLQTQASKVLARIGARGKTSDQNLTICLQGDAISLVLAVGEGDRDLAPRAKAAVQIARRLRKCASRKHQKEKELSYFHGIQHDKFCKI
jgi:hypothetical protein